MGRVLAGKSLDEVRTELSDEIKQTMNTETMNFLAFLTFVDESNKNMCLSPKTLKGWLSVKSAE